VECSPSVSCSTPTLFPVRVRDEKFLVVDPCYQIFPKFNLNFHARLLYSDCFITLRSLNFLPPILVLSGSIFPIFLLSSEFLTSNTTNALYCRRPDFKKKRITPHFEPPTNPSLILRMMTRPSATLNSHYLIISPPVTSDFPSFPSDNIGLSPNWLNAPFFLFGSEFLADTVPVFSGLVSSSSKIFYVLPLHDNSDPVNGLSEK